MGRTSEREVNSSSAGGKKLTHREERQDAKDFNHDPDSESGWINITRPKNLNRGIR